jgi:hypothetical protein
MRQIHASPAARVAAYRARYDLVTLSVDIPRDLKLRLEDYMRFKNLTKAQVIVKLLAGQLLRKR